MTETTDTAMYEGLCRGGPLDGQPGESRFPSGFLLVDKASNRAWVYDLADMVFTCRNPDGDALDGAGRRRAADSVTYDVRAL